MLDLKIYFLLFIFYSFIGWLMEVVACSLLKKKIVNRGFLIGPYCPVYGTGLLSVIFLLEPLKSNPHLVLMLGILICSVVEYLTSYIMEKMFHARWWDYSKAKFNLNGRIKLSNSIFFGLAALLFIYIIHPSGVSLLKEIPLINLNCLFWTILAIFTLDNIISLKVVSSFKNLTVAINKDNSEEMINRVKDTIINNILVRRLIKSFPDFKTVGDRIEMTFKTVGGKIETTIKTAIEEIESKFKKNKKK